jgi:hypothetical protein
MLLNIKTQNMENSGAIFHVCPLNITIDGKYSMVYRQ